LVLPVLVVTEVLAAVAVVDLVALLEQERQVKEMMAALVQAVHHFREQAVAVVLVQLAGIILLQLAVMVE
jgi:hypothetical protein